MRNTSRDADTDPESILAEALLIGPENAILKQESDGQAQLVQEQLMPTDYNPRERAALETAGVKFGAILENDPLFMRSIL